MSYGIKIIPDAQTDVRETIDWYNEQKDGLGRRFLQSLAATVRILSENPKIFQVKYKNTRQAPVRGFPFLVHYLFEEKKQRIVILAVLHSSRDPQVWKKRG